MQEEHLGLRSLRNIGLTCESETKKERLCFTADELFRGIPEAEQQRGHFRRLQETKNQRQKENKERKSSPRKKQEMQQRQT